MNEFHLEIAAPDGMMYDGGAYMVSVRGIEGDLAILSGHIPFVTALAPGEVRVYLTEDADIIVTGYGASARIVRSAVNAARAEGIKAGMIRPITLWPFPEKAYADTVETAKAYLVVELSMGQMVDDVRLATSCRRPVRFFGRTGGVIHTPAEILAQIKTIAKEELK